MKLSRIVFFTGVLLAFSAQLRAELYAVQSAGPWPGSNRPSEISTLTRGSKVEFSADSTKRESANSSSKDSLLLNDIDTGPRVDTSIHLHLPLAEHGSLLLDSNELFARLSRRDIQNEYYTGFDELMQSHFPFYTQSLGYHGLPNSWRVAGASVRDNALSFDGRPVNDPGLGQMWLNSYATEFMQSISVLLGSDAVIFSDNSSGMLLNIQEPMYNTKGPYTRLWYADGANGFLSSDGIYSQNIAPNWNMTLGFRRQAGDGRYANQAMDSWNVRALVRWNISERTNVSLTENFVNQGFGANGGVDTTGTTDINDEISAVVRYPSLNERLFRHDLTLSGTSRFTNDSSSVIQYSAYYSHGLWNLGRDSALIFSRDSALGLNWSWIRSGLSARYKQSLFSGARIIAGAELEYQKGTQSDYSPAYARQRVAAYGQLHLDLSHDLMISGGLRLQNLDNRASISIGAAAVLRVAQSWTLRVDLSQSARLPSVVEGWGLEQERSTFAYADLGFNTTQTNASILAYTRIVTNPIVASAALVDTNKRTLTLSYRNADKRIVSGLLLRASHRFSNFRAEGNAQLSSATLDGQADKSLPAAYVQASFRYEAAIAKNLVYLGLAAHAQSSMQPNAFVPMEWAQVPGTIAQSAQFGGIDVLAGADLGDATIKVRYQNILSNSFSSLSIFPNPVRNLSISVAWTFFD